MAQEGLSKVSKELELYFISPLNGWISVEIPEVLEKEAREIRIERDAQYGNIFEEEDTDKRWTGDLGEIVFNTWLKSNHLRDFQWIKNNSAGQPDFITPTNVRIGVKTVKRKVEPRMDYTAQITAQHSREPIDHFFFMTYQFEKKNMWLLGGIDRNNFLKKARYYSEGQWVHKNYQIRKGHEIYNIEIGKLIAPLLWLPLVTGSF
jgi:hypothetical protein